MLTPKQTRHFSPVAGLVALTLSAASAAFGDTLVMNGKTASTSVRPIGGSAYVKLSDVAKALGMVLVKHPGGYELIKSGGTDQVQAMTQGKIGDVLFDGYWRFQIKSVEMPDSYTPRFLDYTNNLHIDRDSHLVTPNPRYKMVVVRCRMTNAQKSTQTFWFGVVARLNIHNALTDTDGESYPPDSFDLDGDSVDQSKPLLPGAKTDFTILFQVPESVTRDTLKDLVFTLMNNDSRPGNDVRVSLTP